MLMRCNKCGNIIFDISTYATALSCSDGGSYEEISADSLMPEIMSSMKKINKIFENLNVILALEKDKFTATQNKIKKRILNKKKNKKGK